MSKNLIKKFLALESASGIVLFTMAVFAMGWANSPLADFHAQFVAASLFWINEGLMAVFFLVVGLELKRGFLEGPLATFRDIALPAFAALGGMLVPALIYGGINYHDPIALKGIATPVATDIAFALGVLSLFGRKVPLPLKLFLLALAIFDDIGAIIIIALFYSHGLAYVWLGAASACVGILYLLNIFSVRRLWPYLFIGIVLWATLLHSGVHPTLAGILLAFFIPDQPAMHSPLHRLENALHPWVAYFIMPLFALANAGFSLHEVTLQTLTAGVVLGIALGLFLGKQIGVFGFSWLLIRLRFAKLPEKITWLQLYAVALVAGIGFTMSLFLGTLAFASMNIYLVQVRLGVIIGSILSGLFGALVLFMASAQKNQLKRSASID